MTIFEYIMVMVSLVLALALSHVMRHSADVFGGERRYGVHATWVVLLVFWILQGWWSFWDLRDGTEWTFATYLAMFPYPLLLFLTASVLVPSYQSGPVDWKEFFFERKRWFFSIQIIAICEAILTPVFLFDAPVVHPFRIFQLGAVLFFVTGIVGRTERTQSIVVICYAVWEVSGNFLARFQLGALSGP